MGDSPLVDGLEHSTCHASNRPPGPSRIWGGSYALAAISQLPYQSLLPFQIFSLKHLTCPDPVPSKQAGEFELFKQQICVNPKCLDWNSLGKRHKIGTAWRHKKAESSSSAKQLGMQFSISTPGQLVFQTLPLQTATHIYTQVLPLRCRQKKALLPLHLVLGANCCARTRVVLSYCCNVFFQRRQTLSVQEGGDLQLVSKLVTQSASGCSAACVICSQSFCQAWDCYSYERW